jgi:hypothetical protein
MINIMVDIQMWRERSTKKNLLTMQKVLFSSKYRF